MTRIEETNDSIEINGLEVSSTLFYKEIVNYRLVDRENEIDELYRMIAECGNDRHADKELMIEDQQMLIALNDKYVFSSISTNAFYAYSTDPEYFNTICKDIITAHYDLIETEKSNQLEKLDKDTLELKDNSNRKIRLISLDIDDEIKMFNTDMSELEIQNIIDCDYTDYEKLLSIESKKLNRNFERVFCEDVRF